MTEPEQDQSVAEPETETPKSRRGMLTAAAVAASAAVLTAVPSRQSKADLTFVELVRGLAPLLAVLRDMFDLTREQFLFFQRLYAFIRFMSVASAWRLINSVLDLFGGEDSFITEGSVEPAVEKSYPVEPITTPIGMMEQTLVQSAAQRARVIQSQEIHATVSAAQGELATEEAEIMAEAQAAETIPALLQGILAMQGATNARLGHLSMQLAAHSQLTADQVLLVASQREQATWQNEEFIGPDAEAINPPVERSVPQ